MPNLIKPKITIDEEFLHELVEDAITAAVEFGQAMGSPGSADAKFKAMEYSVSKLDKALEILFQGT